MAVPLEQFVKQLEDSGVLGADTLKGFIPPKASPKDAEELARELVRKKKLTKFQAEEVYRGKGKSLVMGNYVLMEKIGAGGMGQVFKAEHRRLKRVVAVKLLPAAMTSDKAAIARFEREVEAAAKLRHPNIVAADDADQANGVHFLVMELVDGSDLSALVKKDGPLPVEKAVNYILQAAKGLEAAHAVGIVHRDIKPANLLLDKKGTVKILDMGLARLSASGDAPTAAELTSSGAVMGTVDYIAPEQALSTKTADARADIYSLGCSLYYLLTGEATYSGDTLMAKLLAHREQPIPSLRAARPEVPEQLEVVFKKMLAKKVEARYQTMTEVVAALEAVASREPASTVNSEEATAWVPSAEERKKLSKAGASKPLGPLVQVVASEKSKHLFAKFAGGAFATIIAPILVTFLIKYLERDDSPPNPPKTAIDASSPEAEETKNYERPLPAIAPFDAKQALAHQEAWAKHLGTKVEIENSLGMKLRLIPPGEFMMGSTPAEIEEALKFTGEDKHWQENIKSEAPQHKVILTQPLYLGTHEVTQAEYEKVMEKNPSHFAPMGAGKDAVAKTDTTTHPVERVSWNDAAEFCARLSEKEKLKPFYSRSGETVMLAGTGYRLVSEAEWEFACRAGATTKYWIGDQDEDLPKAAWFSTNSGNRTHQVGKLKANPFGLYDIHGNVWEWVQNGWDLHYYRQFQDHPALNPSGPVSYGSPRVIRGGGWRRDASLCRASTRHASDPVRRNNGIGFRVSMVIEPQNPGGNAAKVSSSVSRDRPHIQTTSDETAGKPADAPPPAIAPFDANQATAYQEAWAQHLGAKIEIENSLGMKLRLIPPGEFLMGSPQVEIDALVATTTEPQWWQDLFRSEGPRHKVKLTQAFYLGNCEVTQKQYQELMGVNPSHFSPTGSGKDAVKDLETSQHPVEMVSWFDAVDFCNKLSEREKRSPYYVHVGKVVKVLGGTGYRLPTEAEWEYGCRAGSTTRWSFGDTERDLAQHAWFPANSNGRTQRVGELPANPFGLHDLYGNVWEWCWDWHGKYAAGAVSDPMGSAAGSARVVRGGAYNGGLASYCRSAIRGVDVPVSLSRYGFRVSCGL